MNLTGTHILALSSLFAVVTPPASCEGTPTLERLAERVIEDDGAEEATAALPAAGPIALEALVAARDRASLEPAERGRVDAAIDRVAGQRYASLSHLYWYTDLEQAKAEATRLHRPILSLRLLGRLTDELSCANSRFFRAILYPHPDVSAKLASEFVLHWSTEREPPVITIDFGDGRTLRRTVTGNSAHYVLDADGRVVDAIPGLSSPAAFLERLEWARSLAGAPPAVLASSHRVRATMETRVWRQALAGAGVPEAALRVGQGGSRAPAGEAMVLARSKAWVEAPYVLSPRELERFTTDSTWEHLARAEPVELAEATLAIIRSENPSLDASTRDRMVERLKESLARDTVQNEHLLHRKIDEELAARPFPPFEAFNIWVYGEVFATPASDPWLGLHDDTIYTALEHAGVEGEQNAGETIER